MKVTTSIRRIVDQFEWHKGCETWKSGSYGDWGTVGGTVGDIL